MNGFVMGIFSIWSVMSKEHRFLFIIEIPDFQICKLITGHVYVIILKQLVCIFDLIILFTKTCDISHLQLFYNLSVPFKGHLQSSLANEMSHATNKV